MSGRDTNGALTLLALALVVVTWVMVFRWAKEPTSQRRNQVLASWGALVLTCIAASVNYTMRVTP